MLENNDNETVDAKPEIDIDLTNQINKPIDKGTTLKWYRLNRALIKGCHSDIWDNYCYQNVSVLGADAFKFEPCINYYLKNQGIKINDKITLFIMFACGCEIPDTYVQIESVYAEKLKLIVLWKRQQFFYIHDHYY